MSRMDYVDNRDEQSDLRDIAIEKEERMLSIDQATDRIRKRLSEYYETPLEIDAWLNAPQKLLDYRTARNLIAVGKAADVERLLDQLDQGTYL